MTDTDNQQVDPRWAGLASELDVAPVHTPSPDPTLEVDRDLSDAAGLTNDAAVDTVQEFRGQGLLVPSMLNWGLALVAAEYTQPNGTRGTFPMVTRNKGLANERQAPAKQVVLRTNADGTTQPLGVVGPDYAPITNEMACEPVLSFADSIGARVARAGAFDHGRRCFIQVDGCEADVVPGDSIAMRHHASWTHDGTGVYLFGECSIRAICRNTEQMASRQVKAKGGAKVKHTSGAYVKMASLAQMAAAHRGNFKSLMEGWRAMAAFDVNQALLDQFLAEMFPIVISAKAKAKAKRDGTDPKPSDTAVTKATNKRQRLAEYFESSPGSQYHRGNAWGLFNAATYYAEHDASATSVKRLTVAGVSVDDARAEYAWGRSAQKFRQRATIAVRRVMGLPVD